MTVVHQHRYTRRRRIATGGMGEVWLAHDEVLDREVAVKFLKREYADDDAARARFLHEARSAALLQHPGIAAVYDFGEEWPGDGTDDAAYAGLPFLVMEYVEGRTLSSLLAPGEPMPPEQARALVLQVADALAQAHAAGVVHRDVKPANLLVTPDREVKVTDFGISRTGVGLALTATGQLMGTPSYLAPEVAEGETATPASDVYALGVVLFECLTGERPFTGETPVAIALAHLREPIPDLPPSVPADLAAVTRRALAKDPAERYPDAGAFAEALRATGDAPTEGTQLLPVVTPPPEAEPVAGEAVARTGAAAWLRNPIVLAGAAVAVLLLVIGLALASGGGDEPKAPTPTPSASPTPKTVRVDPKAYVGKPVGTVRTALTRLGLRTRVVTVDNPGGHTSGTVASLAPTGVVREATMITVRAWGAPPPPPAPKPAPKPAGGGHGDHHKGKGKKH